MIARNPPNRVLRSILSLAGRGTRSVDRRKVQRLTVFLRLLFIPEDILVYGYRS